MPNYKKKALKLENLISVAPKSRGTRRKIRKAKKQAILHEQRQNRIDEGEKLTESEEPSVSSETTSEEDEADNQIIKFSKSTNKIRGMICKHFMSRTAQELEKSELSPINIIMMFGLIGFKVAMFKVLNQDMYKNLGRKYQFIGVNRFKNDYMRLYI